MNKTMVMKKDSRKRDIKSKLIAAIAMLMVSSIMVVSSTYAWFTLSTAPEVKGISTAIGANGNLEMALLPNSGLVGDVGDATGNLTTEQANTTWGNLVDVSSSTYGLDKIALFPSKLATDDTGTKLSSHYLGYPKYGADGRFNGTIATTASTATYSNGAFGGSGYGVRVVGTSSGMSARELAYREALAAANDAFNNAITQTKSSASSGGSSLASLAVAKATGTTKFTSDDVADLVTAYTSIQTALNSIETALREYVTAVALIKAEDDGYTNVLAALENATWDTVKSYADDTVDGYIDALQAMQSKVSTSLSELSSLAYDGTEEGAATATYYTWSKISPYVTALADVDAMLLNGKSISYYMEKDSDGKFVNINELTAQMNNLVLEVNPAETLNEGETDGLYVRMADFVNDYTAPVTISGVSYGGLTVDNLGATMKVTKRAATAYLTVAKTAATTVPDNAFGTGGGSTLSDYYGYILDMAFRTNAAGSYLQLQTEAVDRIYDSNNSTDMATMGGGSNMTYTITNPKEFSAEKLANLMSYIRVVFFDPNELTIYGEARLDRANPTITNNEDGSVSVTMDLLMWNANATGGATWATSNAITELTQNTAQAISVLVYLDGEKLTNADVANAELKGTMNIQFSSSAELVPMEYGDLLNGNTTTTEEYTVTVNGITATGLKAQAGQTYTLDLDDYLTTGQTLQTVSVTMGGTEVTGAWNSTDNTVTVENVNGNIAVTVTLVETTPETTAASGG